MRRTSLVALLFLAALDVRPALAIDVVVPTFSWNNATTSPLTGRLRVPEDPSQRHRPTAYRVDFSAAIRDITPGDPAARSVDFWAFEPYTGARTSVQQPLPLLRRRTDGSLFVDAQYPQRGNDARFAYLGGRGTTRGSSIGPGARAYDEGPGLREVNEISPYFTAVTSPDSRSGLGFTAISIGGFVWHGNAFGDVIAIGGRYTPPNEIPPKPDGASKRMHGDHDLPFEETNDLAIHKATRRLFITDRRNNRVAVAAEDPGVPESQRVARLRVRTCVTVPNAQTLDWLDSDTLLVGSRDGGIYTVDLSRSTGTTCPSRAVLRGNFGDIMTLRVGANGLVLFTDATSHTIFRLNTTTWTRSFFHQMLDGDDTTVTPHIWTWFDVDVNGTVGPVNDVLYTAPGSRPFIRRLDRNGTLVTTFRTGGPFRRGPFRNVLDAPGHYPWAVSIHRERSAVLFSGFGNTSSVLMMPRSSQFHPTPGDADNARYLRGQSVWRNGHPIAAGIRAGFAWYAGRSGRAPWMPVLQGHELLQKSPAALLAWMQAGGYNTSDGPIPFTSAHEADMRYFLKQQLPQFPRVGGTPLPPPPLQPPPVPALLRVTPTSSLPPIERELRDARILDPCAPVWTCLPHRRAAVSESVVEAAAAGHGHSCCLPARVALRRIEDTEWSGSHTPGGAGHGQ